MSTQYICDVEECTQDGYPLTFEAKETLIRLNPHLVICGVVEPNHFCLECMENYTCSSTPLFIDDDWIDIECCNNCKYYENTYRFGFSGKCTRNAKEFEVTSNYRCVSYCRKGKK